MRRGKSCPPGRSLRVQRQLVQLRDAHGGGDAKRSVDKLLHRLGGKLFRLERAGDSSGLSGPRRGRRRGDVFPRRPLLHQPLLAALATLLCPVFLVSSTTVMSDTMMLAFWVWAMIFWLRSAEGGSHVLALLSACLIAVAALTKYFAVALVPLLLAYSLLRRPRGDGAFSTWRFPLPFSRGTIRSCDRYTGIRCSTGRVPTPFPPLPAMAAIRLGALFRSRSPEGAWRR